MSENITVCLTNRNPVTINTKDWPLIASSKEYDGQYEFQASRKTTVKVRQHNDGRTIVYGFYTTAWQSEHNLTSGYIIDPDDPESVSGSEWLITDDIREHIRLVCQELNEPLLAQRVLDDLPAEDLTTPVAEG